MSQCYVQPVRFWDTYDSSNHMIHDDQYLLSLFDIVYVTWLLSLSSVLALTVIHLTQLPMMPKYLLLGGKHTLWIIDWDIKYILIQMCMLFITLLNMNVNRLDGNTICRKFGQRLGITIRMLHSSWYINT